jgi:hypothetical protein
MATNLMDMFTSQVGDVLKKHASGRLDESAAHIDKATNAVVACLFAGLIKSSGTDDDARAMRTYLTENGMDGALIHNIHAVPGEVHKIEELLAGGEDIVRHILGDTAATVSALTAAQHEVKKSSVDTLMNYAAPLVMHVTGKIISDKALDDIGIRTLLQDQWRYIRQDLPRGMDQLPGFRSLPAHTGEPVATASGPVEEQSPQTTLSKLLPWIVLLLAAMGLFYFVENGCGS